MKRIENNHRLITNSLESTTKMSKKEKKKGGQMFFALKYVIECYKTQNK
jgi:hypothetical protein